jgi:HAE1 family hydrophobic/amphiphilic exporter-1
MSISSKVAARPVLILIVFVLVAVVGVYLLSGIAVDMFPEIEMPALLVSTTYPGADPETVEKSVTQLLESNLVNVSGLKQMKSTSQEHASIIVLEFDYGSDLDNKINRVRERIDLVRNELPQNAEAPVIMQFDPFSEPILRIAVRGDRNPNELRLIAENIVQDRLEQIDGVASADIEGGQEAIVRVELSQNRLEAYGLTITEIAGSLAVQNLELGAGSIEDGLTNYSIRTSGEYASVTDIAETVVAKINGADIKLRDIGTVAMGYRDETSAVYINGQPGVYVSIMKQSGSNAVAVADRIYARLPQLQDLIPPDITLEISQDDTVQTRSMIRELISSAVQGIALAMAVLLIFLRNFNGTIIVGLSIPLSVLITLLVMSFSGITLNMMTLAGLILGVGMIVDASIVILENIFTYRERGAKPSVAAVLGSQEVLSSIISSTLTTICVFLPIYIFKNRLELIGVLVQDMIFTVGISLAASLLVAMFLVPVLASKWFPIHTRTQRPLKNPAFKLVDTGIGAFLESITKGYRLILRAALNHRLAVVVLVISAFAGSILAFARLDMNMTSIMEEDTVTLDVEMPMGTRYEDTKAVMLQLQEIAMNEVGGAMSVIAAAGSSGSMSFTNQGSHTGQLTVKLDLEKEGSDSDVTVKDKLRRYFNDFPGARFSFTEGMGDVLAGGADIDIILRIDDLTAGIAEAGEIASIIREAAPEITELAVSLNEGLPQVEVSIDRTRAYNLGLNVASVAGEISAAMNGIEATGFRYEGNEYPVTLLLQEDDRYKIPDLDRIFSRSSTGGLVALSNFASIDRGFGPISIDREDQSRVIHITGNVPDGYRISDEENKIRNVLEESGHAISFDGENGETQNMFRSFLLIITLALILVFGVMAGQYESFKDPLINFCTIPLMLIGVVAMHIVTRQPLSAFTLIGLVMLAGIVVNNGIILVDYTNLLVGRGLTVWEACLEAGTSRLRPVLMTTLTTIMGLVPMAFFPSRSSGMIQPIGIAVIGGLSSSTIITLLFIPVLYSCINEKRGGKGREAA